MDGASPARAATSSSSPLAAGPPFVPTPSRTPLGTPGEGVGSTTVKLALAPAVPAVAVTVTSRDPAGTTDTWKAPVAVVVMVTFALPATTAPFVLVGNPIRSP